MANGKPGRRKGTTKKVVTARSILSTYEDLQEAVNQDVLEAYEVIRTVLKDQTANPATRRQCANDVIKMYDKMADEAEQIVNDFENGGSQKQSSSEPDEQGPAQAEDTGVVKLKFSDNTESG